MARKTGNRGSGILIRYVSREYLFSFFISFLFFVAIFFVNQILYLARDRLSQNVGFFDTLRLIVYALPAIIALSFPFGSLLGILMTVGKLSSDREILALQASGIALGRLFVPLLILGLGLSSISFVMNDYFLPLGTLRYTTLYQELLFANSELALAPNSIQRYERTTLVTGPVRDGVFLNTMLLDTSEDGKSRVITAREVRIVRNARQDGVISLELTGVTIHETDPARPRDFNVLTSDLMIYSILLREVTAGLRNPGPREMSSLDVWDLIQARQLLVAQRWEKADRTIVQKLMEVQHHYNLGDYTRAEALLQPLRQEMSEYRADRTLQLYRIEFWKKIAIPMATFTFLILGFPIGLTAKHNGRAVGFGFGVLFSVVYWAMLLGAETLGSRNLQLSPAIIMFSPNILMVLVGSGIAMVRSKR